MVRITVDVDGAAPLAAQYRAVAGAIRQLTGPTRRAANAAKDIADALAPRRTGALIRSGRVRVTGSTGILDYTIRYAGYVEYGTSKMHARSFIRPAATIAEPRMVEVYDDHVDRATRPIR